MKKLNVRALKGRGFTLVELAVVVAIIGVLSAVLLNRALFYQEQAEKTAMEQTVGTIRSALHIQMAALFAKGRANDIPLLLKQNPMDWLAEKPMNYKGEYFAPKGEDIEPGTWYFDRQSGHLVYTVRNDAHFQVERGEPNRVQFRAALVTALQKSGGADDNAIEGATLGPVIPYKWF